MNPSNDRAKVIPSSSSAVAFEQYSSIQNDLGYRAKRAMVSLSVEVEDSEKGVPLNSAIRVAHSSCNILITVMIFLEFLLQYTQMIRRAYIHQHRAGAYRYDEAVKEALIYVWEGIGRICSERLKTASPSMAESLERYGHLGIDPDVRERLLSANAATVDRLLKPVREQDGCKGMLQLVNAPKLGTIVVCTVPVGAYGLNYL